MGNQLTGTELAAIIPEIWRGEIMSARYSASLSDKVAFTDTPEVMSKGDIYHIPIFPRLSVNAVGSDGTVTNQSITLTDNSITINNWFEATVEIVDNAGYQSMLGDGKKLAQEFAKEFGPRLAERQDSDLFALFASFTTAAVGSTASPAEMSSAMLRLGLQRLDENRVPKSERSLVLSPQAYWELFSEDKLALAYATGLSKGVTVGGPEIVPTLFGVKFYQSPEVTISAGPPAVFRNILAHKEGWVQITQKNVQIVPLAKIALSTRITGHVLYEPSVIRADHGVVINSADT